MPAMVGLQLIRHFAYHSAPAWLPGCAAALALAAALWLWIFLRAEESFLRTLTSLVIGTLLWFCVLVAIFRARFMFDHHNSTRRSDVLVVIISGAVAVWLRRVVIRRNEEVDRQNKA
ncbi:MAG TPA: hypothetical protein VLK27_13515 [Chthoniobacterales bacterium]|nr:hypothetical protein [Chthoniobacterales bacterium]